MGKCIITFEDGEQPEQVDFGVVFDPPPDPQKGVMMTYAQQAANHFIHTVMSEAAEMDTVERTHKPVPRPPAEDKRLRNEDGLLWSGPRQGLKPPYDQGLVVLSAPDLPDGDEAI